MSGPRAARATQLLRTRWKWLAAAALIVLLLAFGVGESVGYYFLHGTFNPCEHAPPMELQGNVLVLGDIHFRGVAEPRFRGLPDAIRSSEVRHVILAGDFVDSPALFESLVARHAGPQGAIHYMLEQLALTDLDLAFYWVLGAPAHDPQELKLQVRDEGFTFATVGKCFRFVAGAHEAVVLHGDVFFGGPASFVVNSLAGRPWLETVWKDWVGLDEKTWVVMAHSHVPYIDPLGRVANTGGWTWTPVFAPPTGQGVLFTADRGEMVQIGRG